MEFGATSAMDGTTTTTTTASFMELSGFSSQGRWPRQETLTLLEIRMRLHPKFVQAAAAASKAPLWDEVSRIMGEDYGYQRSGKKCKEKLDNLYKYYKKTKGSGNSNSNTDGMHYRFFNQLDALYGQNHTTPLHQNPPRLIQTHQESILQPRNHHLPVTTSISNSYSMSIESDSNEEGDDSEDEVSIALGELIESQMKRLMEVQESGLAKMVRAIDRLERERVLREEAWRKEENARLEREERLWARERAWIGARDAALVDALNKISCKSMREKPTPRMEMMKEREVLQAGEDLNVGSSSSKSRGWGEEYENIGNLVKLQSYWVEEPEFHEGLCRNQQWFP